MDAQLMDPALENQFVQLLRSGRESDALALLLRAIEAVPTDVFAWRNIAALHGRAGRMPEAEQAYRRAISVANDPKDRQALGTLLASRGRFDEAYDVLREAVHLEPSSSVAWSNLGLALEELGRTEEALDALRRAKALAGDQHVSVLDYHLAALGGGPPPAQCPTDYLVRLFDSYAPRFDDHLINRLNYRVPWLLRDAVIPLLPGGRAGDVIDLGCGTGLCGALLRPIARHIAGVDLSPRMLERASARRVYDQLVQADVATALFDRPRQADLILAADVFVYVGDLAPVFRAAAAALRPSGLFAFTVEVTDGAADFKIELSRRYAHTLPYLRRLASEVGFVERQITCAVLRVSDTTPVEGAVVVLASA